MVRVTCWFVRMGEVSSILSRTPLRSRIRQRRALGGCRYASALVAMTDPAGEVFAGGSHLVQRDLFSLVAACYPPVATLGGKLPCGRSRSVTSPSTR